MKLLEAIQKSVQLKARRKGWSELTHVKFFKGTAGMSLEVEMLSCGMERDLKFEEWFADDWEPVQ